MLWDVVGSVMASIGGAAVIVGAFAHFLGTIWTERISRLSAARLDQEMEALRHKYELLIKDRDDFSSMTAQVYQKYFQKRIQTYVRLLSIKNKYVSGMKEDFLTKELEKVGDVYFETYQSIRGEIITNQIYVSSELEAVFNELRLKAAPFVNEADMAEGYAMGAGLSDEEAAEQRTKHHDDLANETWQIMDRLFEQVDKDVSRLRARIDIDRSA